MSKLLTAVAATKIELFLTYNNFFIKAAIENFSVMAAILNGGQRCLTDFERGPHQPGLA